MDRTVQAKVTKTAVFEGAEVNIADITGDFTLTLEVHALSNNAIAQFAVFDTVDNFTASVPVATHNTKGAIDVNLKQGGQKKSWRKRELLGTRAGTASAELRLDLVGISGTSPSVTYEAWIDYNN